MHSNKTLKVLILKLKKDKKMQKNMFKESLIQREEKNILSKQGYSSLKT